MSASRTEVAQLPYFCDHFIGFIGGTPTLLPKFVFINTPMNSTAKPRQVIVTFYEFLGFFAQCVLMHRLR